MPLIEKFGKPKPKVKIINMHMTSLHTVTDYKWLIGWLVVLVFYGTLTHLRSFRARLVNLATLFQGKPPRQFTHRDSQHGFTVPITINPIYLNMYIFRSYCLLSV